MTPQLIKERKALHLKPHHNMLIRSIKPADVRIQGSELEVTIRAKSYVCLVYLDATVVNLCL